MRELKRRKTDSKHLAGVRRINAEPEDIVKAIFDMVLPKKENAFNTMQPSDMPTRMTKKDSDDKDEEEKDTD